MIYCIFSAHLYTYFHNKHEHFNTYLYQNQPWHLFEFFIWLRFGQEEATWMSCILTLKRHVLYSSSTTRWKNNIKQVLVAATKICDWYLDI